jgi:hypothetical protein
MLPFLIIIFVPLCNGWELGHFPPMNQTNLHATAENKTAEEVGKDRLVFAQVASFLFFISINFFLKLLYCFLDLPSWRLVSQLICYMTQIPIK